MLLTTDKFPTQRPEGKLKKNKKKGESKECSVSPKIQKDKEIQKKKKTHFFFSRLPADRITFDNCHQGILRRSTRSTSSIRATWSGDNWCSSKDGDTKSSRENKSKNYIKRICFIGFRRTKKKIKKNRKQSHKLTHICFNMNPHWHNTEWLVKDDMEMCPVVRGILQQG